MKAENNILESDKYKLKILDLVYYFTSFLGLIILSYEFIINNGSHSLVYQVINLALYSIVLFLTFNNKVSLAIRVQAIGIILYCYSLAVNINYGPISPAILLYFSVPVLTAILGKPKKAFLWILGISISMVLLNYLQYFGFLEWQSPTYAGPGSIFILMAAYSSIAAVTVYAINKILINLKSTLEDLKRSKQSLIEDHKELEAINFKLQENITEKAINQRELAKTKERFKKLFDYATDSIMIHDFDGVFIDINNSAAKRFGIDREAAVGKNIKAFIDEKNISLMAERQNTVRESGQITFESKHLTAGGNYIDVENTLQTLELEGEQLVINISRDISVRKEAEREIENINKSLQQKVFERTSQLEDALEELRLEINERVKAEKHLIDAKEEVVKSLEIEKELSQMKTKFVSMISHEYRTPLTVILSTTYILEYLFDQNDKNAYMKNINKIQSSVKLMTNMLEDVLSIGSMSDVQTKVKPETFDIVQQVKDIIAEYQMIETSHHLYNFNSHLEDDFVYLDQKLSRHILRNLIGNAAKYSAKDTTITVIIYDEDDKIKISVIDQGIGIASDDLEKIFNTFYRSDNVGTISGTGLGLSITKNYVDVMNGTIDVSSEINVGTNFSVTLPKKFVVEQD